MRISDWRSDVCSSDLGLTRRTNHVQNGRISFPLSPAIHASDAWVRIGGKSERTKGEYRRCDDIRTSRRTNREGSDHGSSNAGAADVRRFVRKRFGGGGPGACGPAAPARGGRRRRSAFRSEEHTSELQSLMRSSYAVFCLKKNKQQIH